MLQSRVLNLATGQSKTPTHKKRFVASWNPATGSLRIKDLQRLYNEKQITALQVIDDVLKRIDKYDEKSVFIYRPPKEQLYRKVEDLTARWTSSDQAKKSLPLFGIPYTVKDNIDVAGMPTTAACPEFSYTPTKSATVVKLLDQLGAVMVGKTNLDQFASGLVGVCSPYGAVHNPFNKEYIAGGSSSGAGVSVAAGLASFALGTDTAGSGRVPGCFTNIIGMKPSKGLLSTKGVVAACRMLDCIAILSLTCEDARTVFELTAKHDREDDLSRESQQVNTDRLSERKFTFGVPKSDQLKFFGNTEYECLYNASLHRLESIGGERVEFDYSVFMEAAKMLYQGPPLAERLAFLEDFFAKNPSAGLSVTRGVIQSGYRYSAVETYKAIWRLSAIYNEIMKTVFNRIDVLALPTAGTIYKAAEVERHPYNILSSNANLGYYTNFVNLLDLCGVQIPVGFGKDGLPAGVTLIAPAFQDEYILSIGERFHQTLGSEEKYKFGATTTGWSSTELRAAKLGDQRDTDVIRVTAISPSKDGESYIHSIYKPSVLSNFNGNLTAPEKASSIRFRETSAQWQTDWHHPPRRQYIIQLKGVVEMTASDGTATILNPGDVVLVEDLTGKGHKSKAISGPTKAAFVAVDE